jgi:hypothetical protein
MRMSRRFRPAFDCMSARIVPSAISLLPQVPHIAATTVTAMDSTGDPGTNPSSGGTGPAIFTPPAGGSGTGGVC